MSKYFSKSQTKKIIEGARPFRSWSECRWGGADRDISSFKGKGSFRVNVMDHTVYSHIVLRFLWMGATTSEWPLVVLLSPLSASRGPLSLLFCRKGAQIGTKGRWFFETLVCYRLSLLPFWWKLLFPAPTTCLWIYWPVTWPAEQAWIGYQF